VAAATGSYFDALPADDEVPDEILEFFQPEAEEHLQVVSDCLISLEGNNNPEEINKLFRAIHTVKGSAAQVGLKRLGAIAHRVEDLIGRLRDGELEPSPAVVDICLESVDVLKKTLHRQWTDEVSMRTGVDSLLGRIAEFAPVELEDSTATATTADDKVLTGRFEEPAPAITAAKKTLKTAGSGAAAAKSVRIALSRLDRMMNTVGELVINRTRMVGRVAELEKLGCKGRSRSSRRSTNLTASVRRARQALGAPLRRGRRFRARLRVTHRSGRNSAISKWTATTISIFFRGPWRKSRQT
jgi:chemotaxis protein histidine kinase CheA